MDTTQSKYIIFETKWYSLMEQGHINLAELKLIRFLMDREHPLYGDWCFLSNGEIARELQVSSRWIRACFHRLTGLGIIESAQSRTQIMLRRIVRDYRVGSGVTEGRKRPEALYSFHSSMNLKEIHPPKTHQGNSASEPMMREGKQKSIEREYMPLMPESECPSKPLKNPPSENHTQVARQLYEALKGHPTRPPKLNAWRRWAFEIQLLEVKDGIAIERIMATMNWLCSPKQIKGTKCRSGKMFRTMFESLESYSEDSIEGNVTKLTPQEEKAASRHFSKFANDHTKSTVLEAAALLKRSLHRIVDIIEENAPKYMVPHQAKYIVPKIKQLKDPLVLDEILLNLCLRLRDWREWNGDLRPPCKRICKQSSPELIAWATRRGINWQDLYSLFEGAFSDS